MSNLSVVPGTSDSGGSGTSAQSLPFLPLFLVAALLLFWLADYAPSVVNALLILLIVGMLLRNASAWQGAVQAAQASLQASQ